ncbi:TPA: glycosyltransferase [Streptococcus suis]
MKGLYITSQNLEDTTSGVNRKIHMQINAFKRLGVDVEAPELSSSSEIDKFVRRLPFVRCEFEKKLNTLILNREYMNEVKFVYIRHPMLSVQLLYIIKKMSDMGLYVVYEFPTFPYDKNSDKLSAKVSLLKDKWSREKLYKYVDIGVNYSGFNEIFSIPCLSISNGIDTDSITPHNKLNGKNIISFIGVALLARWNGYDRLIKAIEKYNSEGNSVRTQFHIVGKGDMYNELKQQIHDSNLEEDIIMHGYMSGKELDDLYNQCDIGVGTLNPSRKYKNHIMSSLKTKEYTAKGIPFIKGDIDEVFDNSNPDFVYNVSDDETPIDINKIVNWYGTLIKQHGEQGIVKEMRDFAHTKLSWEKQLYPVVEAIEENINE